MDQQRFYRGISGKAVLGCTAFDDVLDEEGTQWGLGRRLATLTRAQEFTLVAVNGLAADEAKACMGRSNFSKFVRRTLDNHPDVGCLPTVDRVGKWRCALAMDLALMYKIYKLNVSHVRRRGTLAL